MGKTYAHNSTQTDHRAARDAKTKAADLAIALLAWEAAGYTLDGATCRNVVTVSADIYLERQVGE